MLKHSNIAGEFMKNENEQYHLTYKNYLHDEMSFICLI